MARFDPERGLSTATPSPATGMTEGERSELIEPQTSSAAVCSAACEVTRDAERPESLDLFPGAP